jgi:hypothetical protein
MLERVMNSAEKPHRNANVSVSSVLPRSSVFRISKPFLSKFITASSKLPGRRAYFCEVEWSRGGEPIATLALQVVVLGLLWQPADI